MLNIIIYSYKNKDLPDRVRELYENTTQMDPFVCVIDQHQLNRKEKFSGLDNLWYEHVFWDKLNSPCLRKRSFIFHEEINQEYTMVMSDDISLVPGWDLQVKKFLDDNPKSIVSGFGSGEIEIKDKYYLTRIDKHSESFSPTNYVDSKFIVGTTETMRELDYPVDVKYFGESERLSLWAKGKGIKVFTAPSTILEVDHKARTLENLYVTFSIEHNYNQAVTDLKNNMPDFFTDNGIDPNNLKRIYYQIDDVPYDPYELEMMNVTQERFIANVKAIY